MYARFETHIKKSILYCTDDNAILDLHRLCVTSKDASSISPSNVFILLSKQESNYCFPYFSAFGSNVISLIDWTFSHLDLLLGLFLRHKMENFWGNFNNSKLIFICNVPQDLLSHHIPKTYEYLMRKQNISKWFFIFLSQFFFHFIVYNSLLLASNYLNKCRMLLHPTKHANTITKLCKWSKHETKNLKKNVELHYKVARLGSRGASQILWVSETRTAIAHANVSWLEFADEHYKRKEAEAKARTKRRRYKWKLSNYQISLQMSFVFCFAKHLELKPVHKYIYIQNRIWISIRGSFEKKNCTPKILKNYLLIVSKISLHFLFCPEIIIFRFCLINFIMIF